MSDTSQYNVLIVDDEEDVISYLSMVLKDGGFNVRSAFNIDDAMTLIQEKKPDLISLDVVMPKGSGAKLLRKLKSSPSTAKIPVMVVTGHARDDLGRTDFEEMTMSGPGLYLEKPVNAQSYLAAVKKMLNMDESEGAEASSETVKEEVQALFEKADAQTMNQILAILKSKKDTE